MTDKIELNADPESTWGASDDYKAAWNEKYGNVSPSASASKGDWVDFAVKSGKSQEEAESLTRDELVAEYGAGVPFVAPAAKNDTDPGQGAGTSASGNVDSAPAGNSTPVTPGGTSGGATSTASGTR